MEGHASPSSDLHPFCPLPTLIVSEVSSLAARCRSPPPCQPAVARSVPWPGISEPRLLGAQLSPGQHRALRGLTATRIPWHSGCASQPESLGLLESSIPIPCRSWGRASSVLVLTPRRLQRLLLLSSAAASFPRRAGLQRPHLHCSPPSHLLKASPLPISCGACRIRAHWPSCGQPPSLCFHLQRNSSPFANPLRKLAVVSCCLHFLPKIPSLIHPGLAFQPNVASKHLCQEF